jgi:hypothetical protein
MYAMPGRAVREVIERCHQSLRGQGNFLQLSGLEVDADGSGDLRILVGDEGHLDRLEATRTYSVATTSYLATSKEAYGAIFASFERPTILEDSIREALESELMAQAPIPIFSDNARWRLTR